MIWLSTLAGTQECSIYFEIRDIEVRRSGNISEGVVRGLLGDEHRELCCEVFLGNTSRVQILPEWTEDGQIEGLDAAIDEADLKQQLIVAVQMVFSQIGVLTSAGSLYPAIAEQNHLTKKSGYLAA